MSIKNILVAFNGSDSSQAALKVAQFMHGKYDAHITGLLAHQSAQARLRQETWIPDDLKDALGKMEETEHARIRKQYESMASASIAQDRLHWIEEYGSSDQTIADYSLMYDLAIVGRRDVLMDKERYELHPDRIAERSGRPVIAVPRVYDEARFQENAVIAWDGNRAATNALWAAMDILETKQRVSVVTVDTKKTGSPLPGIDVITSLLRHGINAELVRLQRSSGGIASSITEFCDAQGAGLLIMGATPTHSFREQLFGGTGKEILENTKIPVFISR